jgi:hypothetical protein
LYMHLSARVVASPFTRWQPIELMLWPHQHTKLSQLAAGSRRKGP